MQITVISGLCAIVFYLIATVLQGRNLTSSQNTQSHILALGILAVIAHALSAYGVIRTNSGYHFGVFEISTLITVSISIVVLISSLKKPLQNLFLGTFPLAIITIALSLILDSTYPPTDMSVALASHVLISILAYSFFTIAALQAAFLAYQNHQLKHAHPGGVLSKFPPLQDMEAFLFELLWVGQLLLSLGILVGLVFIDDFWSLDGIPHKTILSILAWIVFAVLLWGRHQLGWRGQTAIRGTLGGFALLILAYYGTKFVLEFILS